MRECLWENMEEEEEENEEEEGNSVDAIVDSIKHCSLLLSSSFEMEPLLNLFQ